jgi:hypothetical protein
MFPAIIPSTFDEIVCPLMSILPAKNKSLYLLEAFASDSTPLELGIRLDANKVTDKLPAFTKLTALMLATLALPLAASNVILPVVIPTLTLKFLVVILFYILINP